jgi:hypothetical protein
MSFFTPDLEVWLLLISCLLPVLFLLIHLVNRKPISRLWLFFWGVVFVLLGGINIVVLRRLGEIVMQSQHTWDDVLFGPTYSIAFYVLPLLCAGVGINLITEVITSGIPMERNSPHRHEKTVERERSLPENSQTSESHPDNPTSISH